MRLLPFLIVLAAACRGPVEDDTGTPIVDNDADGVPAELDCNDDDAAAYPGNTESCDGVDNDCNGDIDDDASDAKTFYADADDDGHGTAALTTTACDAPEGYTTSSDDCNDASAAAYPGAVEVCDGIDNDCNGAADDAVGDTWYTDADGDGHGDPALTVQDCDGGSGVVAAGDDCDDTTKTTYPGALELCNSVDDDCDTEIDEEAVDAKTFYADADGDTYGDAGSTETACAASGGFVENDDDCDDAAAGTYPGATETCDGVDQDCDGTADDGATDVKTYYLDADGDGFGTSVTTTACAMPSGYAEATGDCNDASAEALPGGTEICDGLDNDCNGEKDEGVGKTWYLDSDADGFGDPSTAEVACSAPTGKYIEKADDCNDADKKVNPDAAEIWYDDKDQDCKGDSDFDQDGDGEESYVEAGGKDCDDTNAAETACGTADAPGDSCLTIHESDASLATGKYFVDPPGNTTGAPIEVYCDMETDGGGYTFLKRDTGGTAYARDAEKYCGDRGMQLFVPRTKTHLASAFKVAIDASLVSASKSYLYILGVYPKSNGQTCSAQPLNSTNITCNWQASDGGAFWIGDKTNITEPNGDNDTKSSMYYDFTDAGVINWYNDAYVGTGYGSRYFMCDVGDKGPQYPLSCAEAKEWDPDAESGVFDIDPYLSGTPIKAYCDMETDGGGWTMCYTEKDKMVHISTEVTYDSGKPYGKAGYRSDCRNLAFREVLYINEDTGKKSWFSRDTTGLLQTSRTLGYNAPGSTAGLFTPHGDAKTTWKYQLNVCDAGWMWVGYMMTGYTSCYKQCGSWCSDTTTDYYRTDGEDRAVGYNGVAFAENGHDSSNGTSYKTMSVGLR